MAWTKIICWKYNFSMKKIFSLLLILFQPLLSSFTLVGEGVRGKVFQHTQEDGKTIAIKTYHNKQELEEKYGVEDLSNVFAEDGTSFKAVHAYNVSQQLDHPAILKIYAIKNKIEANGQVHTCLEMEYVEGKTLLITEPASQSLDQAVKNALTLINALQYGFTQNLIYIDLWPGNIMFDQEDALKLIDIEDFFSLDLFLDDPQANRQNIHREFLQRVIKALVKILACAPLSEENIHALGELLVAVLVPYGDKIDQPVTSDSAALFMTLLDDLHEVISGLNR